ncbi:plasma membrane fusion protein prm1 [Rhizophlyctis rosea]|nr:plasma membrane fusion protein prm1 [Rhizophlyctis rosea]
MPSFNRTDPSTGDNRYDIRRFYRFEDEKDVEKHTHDTPHLISFHDSLPRTQPTRTPSPPSDTPSHTPPETDHLSPYPSLRAQLTRAYASNLTASLVLTLTTLFLLLGSLSNVADSTKSRLSSSCTALEATSTSVVSLPHYSAIALNNATRNGIESVVRHISNGLVGAVELLRFLVLFILRRYQRLLLCVLDTLVQAALGAVSQYADQVVSFVNTQLASIESALNDGLNALDKAGASLVGLFGQSGNTFTLPGVQDKLNFQIPHDFVDTLQGLKNKVPTLDEVEKKISDIVSTPFIMLENLIEGSMNASNIIDPTRFQIAAPQPTIVKFCADKLDLTWVDKVQEALTIFLIIGAVLLIIAFILAVIFNAYMIRRTHTRFESHVQQTARLIQTANTTTTIILTTDDCEHQARERLHAALNPMTTRINTTLTRRIKSRPNKSLATWFLNYTSHRPSLLCLIMGLTGLIAIALQLALLSHAQASLVPQLATDLHQTALDVSSAVHQSIVDATHPYVVEINTKIDDTEGEINDKLFGWVNGTFDAINNTISTFTNGFNEVLNDTLSDVPVLRDAVRTFGMCIMGNTLESLAEAANALRTRLSVHIPRVDDSSIVNLNSTDVDALLGRVAAASSSSKDGSTGEQQTDVKGFLEVELIKMIELYQGVLRSNLVPFAVLLVFGSGVMVMGCIRCLIWIFLKR